MTYHSYGVGDKASMMAVLLVLLSSVRGTKDVAVKVQHCCSTALLSCNKVSVELALRGKTWGAACFQA